LVYSGNHAVDEMQQRAISETTVDYRIKWGPKAYGHKGPIIRCFDKSLPAQLWVHVGEQEAKPGSETNDKKQGSLNILRREDRRWAPALISPFAQTPLFDRTFYRY